MSPPNRTRVHRSENATLQDDSDRHSQQPDPAPANVTIKIQQPAAALQVLRFEYPALSNEYRE